MTSASTSAQGRADAAITPRTATALGWIAVALGHAAFLALHLFQYVGELAGEAGHHHHDHDHMEELAALAEPGMAWAFVAWLALTIAPPVIVLLGGGRRAALATLVVGLLGAALGVLDGAGHAIMDGHPHSLVGALLLIGAPAVVATMGTLRWLRDTKAA